MGRRFAIAASAALALLVGTGSYLASRRLGSLDDLFDTEFGHRLLVKLCLVFVVIVLTFVHAAIQGPELRRLKQHALETPDDAELAAVILRKQRRSGIASAVILLSTLAILAIAASL